MLHLFLFSLSGKEYSAQLNKKKRNIKLFKEKLSTVSIFHTVHYCIVQKAEREKTVRLILFHLVKL